MNKNKHYFFSIFAVLLLIGLFIISIVRLIDHSKTIKDDIISHDIALLGNILKHIDKKCGIIDFEHEKNYIDFLNVESFVGSEIGAMNLMYPEKWEGPYLKDNRTIQEKLYQVIKTKEGYFIAPGDGVKLSNGKIIGKDIVLNKDANIKQMIRNEDELSSDSRPLAMQIRISGKGVVKILDDL